MLREQLIQMRARSIGTLVMALLITAVPLRAWAGEKEVAALEAARASVKAATAESRQALGDAARLQHGSAVETERNAVMGVLPTARSSLGGVQRLSFGNIDIDALARRYEALEGPSGGFEDTDERLLVFISASVPRESLRRLANQARAVSATLVLRGVVGDGFPATAEFLRGLYGEAGDAPRGMIDPRLFDRFNVRQVPAVVLAPAGVCLEGLRVCPDTTPSHVLVAGDVSLEYTLEYIASRYPEARRSANASLARLRGGK